MIESKEGAPCQHSHSATDERDIVNALKIYLADPNYTLFEAHTGAEALDILAGRTSIWCCWTS